MDMPFLTEVDRKTLQSSLLCREMSDASLDRLLGSGAIISKDKYEYLFEQGQPAGHLYIILDGWAQINRQEQDGTSTLIAAFKQSDSLAEAAAILGRKYPASAQAMTDVRVFSISGKLLIELLQTDTSALAGSLSSLYSHLHELVNEVETLKSRTIRERLAIFLLQHIGDAEGACEVKLPFSKTMIAARIGTSPEQLSRTFRELQEYGVHVQGGTATVKNPEALRAMLQRD